jgi:hypothetical protein
LAGAVLVEEDLGVFRCADFEGYVAVAREVWIGEDRVSEDQSYGASTGSILSTRGQGRRMISFPLRCV